MKIDPSIQAGAGDSIFGTGSPMLAASTVQHCEPTPYQAQDAFPAERLYATPRALRISRPTKLYHNLRIVCPGEVKPHRQTQNLSSL